MSDFNDLVRRYLAAWNTTDADLLAKAVAELWTEDGGYTDPLASVSGHGGIVAVISGAQQQFAGLEFRQLGAVDGHHDIVRFRWELVPAGGGESIVEGSDVAVLAEDGRIRAVHGFLDKVPAGV